MGKSPVVREAFLQYIQSMNRPVPPGAKIKAVIGQRMFAAMSAVEGLTLNEDSRRRLDILQANKTLTPEKRRAAILQAYSSSKPGK